MKKYMHIPTLREFYPNGFETPVAEFEETPQSTDWVEFPDPEVDKEIEFLHIDVAQDTPVFSVQLKEPEVVKPVLLERLNAKYSEVLNGGFKLPDSTFIGSDFEDRGIISAMETKLSIDPSLTTIDYKTGSGWVTITRELATAVYQIMLGHVSACDARLQALITQLEAATTSAQLTSIFNAGISEGWPTYE